MDREQKLYYFDNNATTRVAPEVVEAMLPFLTDLWGNASSAYRFGHRIRQYVDQAREKVAALINAEPKEIVFTSCGTESNNAAIHSALALHPGKRHVVMTSVEHSANIKYGEFLQRRAYDVTCLPVESDGSLDIHLLDQSIRPDTAIVSVMWANNETGVIFPIEEAAAICRSRGVLFHTDAVQTPGKVRVDVKSSGVDFLSLSAHKLHAPKGIGMLYVKKRTRFQPYVIGGIRSGGGEGARRTFLTLLVLAGRPSWRYRNWGLSPRGFARCEIVWRTRFCRACPIAHETDAATRGCPIRPTSHLDLWKRRRSS